MKKLVCVMIIVLAALGAVYALDIPPVVMSAGGGGLFDLGIPTADGANDMLIKFGAFGFFDATFVEADLAFTYGIWDKISLVGIELSALGKFPFPVGPVILFPLLGLKFNINPYAAFDGTSMDDPMDMNNMGLQVGGGVDYPITEQLFIRGELLFNVDFNSFGSESSDAVWTVGPRVKVGVGYAF